MAQRYRMVHNNTSASASKYKDWRSLLEEDDVAIEELGINSSPYANTDWLQAMEWDGLDVGYDPLSSKARMKYTYALKRADLSLDPGGKLVTTTSLDRYLKLFWRQKWTI